MSKDDSILITGGSGFIGSHVVDNLVKEGYSKLFSIDRTNSKSAYKSALCNYIVCNITDINALRNVFYQFRFKYIFHFAGNSSVPVSNESPFLDFESNALGSLNIFQLSLEFGIKKIVFTSSASVYGQPISLPVPESHPLNPLSNYAVTKLYGEKLAIAYFQTYGLRSSVIRIFSSYGPRQPRYILFDLLKKLETDKDNLFLLGSSDVIRDYIYVEDAAVAFLKVMKSSKTDGEVFNLSGGNPVTIYFLVKTVCDILNVNPKIVFSENSWKGDIKIFNADISKIQEYVDFVPKTNLVTGLNSTINWFRDNGLINI